MIKIANGIRVTNVINHGISPRLRYDLRLKKEVVYFEARQSSKLGFLHWPWKKIAKGERGA